MQSGKRVAIKFFEGWRIFMIPTAFNANGESSTLLNLDSYFVDRPTSIRFFGYGKQGGMTLYKETNMQRKFPQKFTERIDYFGNQDNIQQ